MGKGGAKKFLYAGPKKNEEAEDLPWSYNPNKHNGQTNGEAKFEVDSAWSIQRNVNLNAGLKLQKDDGLNFSTNKGYYSRYGGGGKEDEHGASSVDKGKTDTSGSKGSWGTSNQTRRPYGYSIGQDAPTTHNATLSPRNVSNSSASVYPQTGNHVEHNSQNGSQTTRPVNSGTYFKAPNASSHHQIPAHFSDLTSSNHSNNTGLHTGVSVHSGKPVGSSGVSQSYTPTSRNTRNSLFSSSQPKGPTKNDLFNHSNPSRSFGSVTSPKQNKSFW